METTKTKTECNYRKSVNTMLSKFCVYAKEYDFMEITEWTNGEGYDISTEKKQFSLTFGEFEAMKYLILKLENDFDADK